MEEETPPDGGYSIWRRFETVIDHGVDLACGPRTHFLSKTMTPRVGYYPIVPQVLSEDGAGLIGALPEISCSSLP
jgi:hypothetical protein